LIDNEKETKFDEKNNDERIFFRKFHLIIKSM